MLKIVLFCGRVSSISLIKGLNDLGDNMFMSTALIPFKVNTFYTTTYHFAQLKTCNHKKFDHRLFYYPNN